MSIFLKRLEIQGFKSFAQKTILEFKAGITAIVGPNGSGKSNIVDALCWALGEREAKYLRGEKGENLIFMGAPFKPAASLAQVRLYFDNQKKQLPLDFEEVVLTRRLDRSGFSEFFLNQSPVLLKKLNEVLVKAHLGSRSMTIIRQGESDIFFKKNPLERKAMLEEFIGLKEFQLKKSQSEHQLENTILNLEKIRMTLAELSPHLRMLKRQTSRWEKRESAEKELKELESKYFSFKLKEIKDGLYHFSAPLSSLDEKIDKEKTEIMNFQKKLKQAEEKFLFSPEFKKFKKENEILEDEKSKLQKKLGHLEAELEIKKTKPLFGQELQMADLIKEIKSRLESSLCSHNLEELRKIVRELLEKIKQSRVFKAFEENDSQKNREIEEAIKELKKVEEKINSFKKEEEKLIFDQEEAKQDFQRIFEVLEKKRKEKEKLEEERNKIFLEKEKMNFKFSELKEKIFQAGTTIEKIASVPCDSLSSEELAIFENKILKLKGKLADIGEVDSLIVKEKEEVEKRFNFLSEQLLDLEKASKNLDVLIKDLERKIEYDFQRALVSINKEFDYYFRLMFAGGRAKLKQENGQGIEIYLDLPRKKITNLEVLSAGEKTLVSMAAFFALTSISSPPFLILDEIDVNLDEKNASKFIQLIKNFSQKTQFIIITHNRATMNIGDVLYGVTMSQEGVSKIYSLNLVNVG